MIADPDRARLHVIAHLLATGPVTLVGDTGARVEVPESLARSFLTLTEAARDGEEVHVGKHDDLIGTQEAARILGLSRPTVVDYVDRGVLASVRTSERGHRRVRLRDVIVLKRRLHNEL